MGVDIALRLHQLLALILFLVALHQLVVVVAHHAKEMWRHLLAAQVAVVAVITQLRRLAIRHQHLQHKVILAVIVILVVTMAVAAEVLVL
jgi:hypothetical protein